MVRTTIWTKGIITLLLLSGLVACTLQIVEQSLPGESFAEGDQGWRITGNGSDTIPQWHANGGNPGGCIFAQDKRPGFWYFVAPNRFVNQVKGGYGHQLRYELKQTQSDKQVDAPDMILLGSDMVLRYKAAYNPALSWTPYVVVLDTSGHWYKKNDKQLASPEELRRVISHLQALWIRGEYRANTDEEGLDNVLFK